MIPLLLCAMLIPTQTVSMRKAVMSEVDYFNRGRDEMNHLMCPNCKEKGGLFMGFHSVGCYGCFMYFGEDEIIKANEVL